MSFSKQISSRSSSYRYHILDLRRAVSAYERLRVNPRTLCDRHNQLIDHHWMLSVCVEACDHLIANQEIEPWRFSTVGLSCGNEFSFPLEGAPAGDKPTDRRLSLDEHNLLPEVQSAYRRGNSTETALLVIFSDLIDAMDKASLSLLSLHDLSFAFDTVDHDILPMRLTKSFDISGRSIQWFVSCPTDGTQSVRMAAKSTMPRKLKPGALAFGNVHAYCAIQVVLLLLLLLLCVSACVRARVCACVCVEKLRSWFSR